MLEYQAKKKGVSVEKYKEIDQLRQRRDKSEEDTYVYNSDEWEDVSVPPAQVEPPARVEPPAEVVQQEDDLDYLWDWGTDDDSDDSDDGRGGGESKK